MRMVRDARCTRGADLLIRTRTHTWTSRGGAPLWRHATPFKECARAVHTGYQVDGMFAWYCKRSRRLDVAVSGEHGGDCARETARHQSRDTPICCCWLFFFIFRDYTNRHRDQSSAALQQLLLLLHYNSCCSYRLNLQYPLPKTAQYCEYCVQTLRPSTVTTI